MEFSINVCTNPDGTIVLEDWAVKYDQYLSEDIEAVTSLNSFKYSETASINTIIKVDLAKSSLLDVLLDKHQDEYDTVTFKVTNDGYYTLDHIVLPTVSWWQNATAAQKDYFGTIYVTDGEKVYKDVDGNLEECTVREILDRNPEDTTLSKCHTHIFFTGNLKNCYINYCKQLFEGLLNICDKGQYKDAQYARDMIWMTLNIIEYLVEFKQYMEAERIIEEFNSCGGYCKNSSIKKTPGCGCS